MEENGDNYRVFSINDDRDSIRQNLKSQSSNIDCRSKDAPLLLGDNNIKKTAWRHSVKRTRESFTLIDKNIAFETENQVLEFDVVPTPELILFNEVIERTVNADQAATKVDVPVVNLTKANTVDIWLMGLAVVLGGQMYGWNEALTSGFATWIIAQVLMGLAFVVLMLSLAEIGSAIAFSGGSYGLARVVLGFFPGFLVGCLELMEYSLMISASVVYIGSVLVSPQFFDCDPDYQPLIWLIIISLFLCINIPSSRVMLASNAVLGGGSLLLFLIYCFGSLPYTSFQHYAPFHEITDDSLNDKNTNGNIWFIGGISGYISILPLTTWGYMGIESIILSTSITVDPHKTVPHASIISIITLFFTNMFIIFVACSLPPGLSTTAKADYFMNTGFNLIFKCSETVGASLILPAQFAMAWGYVLPFGKLLHAMAQSNLTPTWLGLSNNATHNKSMVVGCILAYLVCLFGYVLSEVSETLQHIAILCGFLTYFAQFLAFWMLRAKFSSIQRDFYSPFGLPGVVFACLVFLTGTISVAFFQNDNYIALLSLIIILIILSLYYRFFARNTQTLSKEEQKSVFKLHVINFNLRNQKLMRRGKGAAKSKGFLRYFKSNKSTYIKQDSGGNASISSNTSLFQQRDMKFINPLSYIRKGKIMNTNDEEDS